MPDSRHRADRDLVDILKAGDAGALPVCELGPGEVGRPQLAVIVLPAGEQSALRQPREVRCKEVVTGSTRR